MIMMVMVIMMRPTMMIRTKTNHKIRKNRGNVRQKEQTFKGEEVNGVTGQMISAL